MRAQEAIPKFRELLLNDKSEDVRVEVALALIEMQNESAKKAISEAASLPNLSSYLRTILVS